MIEILFSVVAIYGLLMLGFVGLLGLIHMVFE